jgi:hypothetical protein
MVLEDSVHDLLALLLWTYNKAAVHHGGRTWLQKASHLMEIK